LPYTALFRSERAVDGDAVVVVKNDELREAQMARKADRLMAHAFHEVAVRGEHIGVMIDDAAAVTLAEHAFGQRHADGGGDALAEGAGRRLDARRVAIFGVACGPAAELAEIPDFPDRHVLVAEEIVQ